MVREVDHRFLLRFFFFSSRRRHTRCLSDWSSDVCSSDLLSCRSILARGVLMPNRKAAPSPKAAPVMAGVIKEVVLLFSRWLCNQRASKQHYFKTFSLRSSK